MAPVHVMDDELDGRIRYYCDFPSHHSSLPDRFYWDAPIETTVHHVAATITTESDTARFPPITDSLNSIPGTHAEAHMALLDFCRALGSISLDTPQAATVEEEISSWAKSLFVKDKKSKQLFMVTFPGDAELGLKPLATALGAKELRMASSDDIKATFGIERGCVTAMSVVTDVACAVTSVLDSRLLRNGTRIRMCTGCADALDHSQHQISEQGPQSLLKFLEACKHKPLIYDATTNSVSAAPSDVFAIDVPEIAPSPVVPAASNAQACCGSRDEIQARMRKDRELIPDPVERCTNLCQLCCLEVTKLSHDPVVASEGQTSNQHHHAVLDGRIDGHIVVSLFLKGKKKKTLCLIVRKPSTHPDMKILGNKLAAAGLPDKEYRLADEESMVASLGVGRDFASPLAMIDDVDGSVALVVFDTALEDGKSLWCLPPRCNDASWGLSLAECEKYVAACGAATARMALG